jgi:hypothetical protein
MKHGELEEALEVDERECRAPDRHFDCMETVSLPHSFPPCKYSAWLD